MHSNTCVILCRVSTKEQKESGYSLPAQERLLLDYAQKKELIPQQTFFIAESATNRVQRKIFNQMLTFLQKEKVQHLVCEKVDRLTRNYKDAVTIDDWLQEDEHRQVHLVKDSLILHKYSRSQEKLNWGIRLVLAKNYSDNLSEEIRKSREEKFAQGIFPGASPFGYKGEAQGKREIHVLDPATAPWMRRVFDLVDKENYSLRKLEAHLRALGVCAKSGKPFHRNTLDRYLKNPFYYGDIKWDGKLGPGIHTPLISRAQWERVQTKLRRKETAKYGIHFHLFKGIIRCAGCGGLITWEIQKGHTYGHCNRSRTCPGHVWVKEPNIVCQVQEHLSRLSLRDPQVAEWIGDAFTCDERSEADRREEVLSKVGEALSRIERRLTLLYDDRLDGRISAELYDAKAAELKREQVQLEEVRQAQQGNSSVGGSRDLPGSPAWIFQLAQQVPELFGVAEPDEQREIIQLVFQRLIVCEGRLQGSFTSPFALLAQAVAATNGSKMRATDLPATPSFEPAKVGSVSNKKWPMASSCPTWWGKWDDFRTGVWDLSPYLRRESRLRERLSAP